MPDFGLYGKIVQKVWLALHPGWQVEGTLPSGPAVLLVHHQNLFGPVCAEALLPEAPRLWVLGAFHSRQVCYRQYRGYTFTQRFGWPVPAAILAAGALSLTIPPLIHSVGAIPVYRGHREILDTMGESLDALAQGDKVLICPDLDYADGSPDVGAFYTGFFHLEKDWRRRGNAPLPFVPLYCSRRRRRLIIGPAMTFPHTGPYPQERDALVQNLRDWMHHTGQVCGDLSDSSEQKII